MSAPRQPAKTSMFRGKPQPDPKERLKQAKIFLADEDFHRCLNFKQKLVDIEAYVAFIRGNEWDGDLQLMKHVQEMIDVHKHWVKNATEVPPISFQFAQYPHRNRLLGLVKNDKRRAEIENVKASKLSQNLIPGPAIHKCLEEGNRPSSPDPFLYTKQLAEIRRRQDAETERILDKESTAVWQVPMPVNFNGPYTPTFKMAYEEIGERERILMETLKRLKIAQKLAPHPFIEEILSIIDDSDGVVEDHVENLGPTEKVLTNVELQRLLILSESTTTTSVGSTLPDLSDDRTSDSALFTQIIEGLFQSDLWPAQNSVATVRDIHKRMNAKLAVDFDRRPLTLADVENFLSEMNEINVIRWAYPDCALNVATKLV
jgi:hypothetical protein